MTRIPNGLIQVTTNINMDGHSTEGGSIILANDEVVPEANQMKLVNNQLQVNIGGTVFTVTLADIAENVELGEVEGSGKLVVLNEQGVFDPNVLPPLDLLPVLEFETLTQFQASTPTQPCIGYVAENKQLYIFTGTEWRDFILPGDHNVLEFDKDSVNVTITPDSPAPNYSTWEIQHSLNKRVNVKLLNTLENGDEELIFPTVIYPAAEKLTKVRFSYFSGLIDVEDIKAILE